MYTLEFPVINTAPGFLAVMVIGSAEVPFLSISMKTLFQMPSERVIVVPGAAAAIALFNSVAFVTT